MAESPPSPAELLRSEPYRIFFPLAFVIGAAGIGHWLLFTTGAMESYLATFHAVTQAQSFLPSFAAGFLLTAVPKRTRSREASWVEIGALLVLLPAVSLATLFEAPIAGQLAYLGALLVLAQFAIRRFAGRAAGRRPPAAFVLVLVAFTAGLIGASLVVASLGGALGTTALWLGRAFTLKGVFLCLTLGIGGFFLPLATRGEAAGDLDGSRRARLAVIGYVIAGLAVLGGLALEETYLARLGRAAGGAAALAVIIGSGAFRAPTRPGANRHLLWASIWAVPAGLLAAAALPEHRVAALHITFIGGFGLLAFCVATHVAVGHAGEASEQSRRPWPVVGFGALFALALAARASATAAPTHYVGLLGAAAALWLSGAMLWAAYLFPKLWRAPAAAGPPGA